MKELFEIAAEAFEATAILVLIVGTAYWFLSGLAGLFRGTSANEVYRTFRRGFGKTLLVTLDIMVAADIILTVTLDLSLEALGALGLLVLIRTLLHFVLEVELTGRWPWGASSEGTDTKPKAS